MLIFMHIMKNKENILNRIEEILFENFLLSIKYFNDI
jgi:hypothetical protein